MIIIAADNKNNAKTHIAITGPNYGLPFIKDRWKCVRPTEPFCVKQCVLHVYEAVSVLIFDKLMCSVMCL